MKNKNSIVKVVSLICALAMLAAVAGCSAPAAPSAPSSPSAPSAPAPSTPAPSKPANPIVLKFGHVQANTDPCNDAALRLADTVAKLTDGGVEIQVYPNGEIGTNKDNLEQAARGANIMTMVDAGYMADYVPDYGIMNGPFLFKTWSDLNILANSDWHQSMVEASKEKGVQVLAANWFFGNRHIISDKTITTPADTKGMKIRVPSNEMWIQTVNAMGANPTTIQWPEVYSALSQGVVDAAEAPLGTIFNSKLQEAKKKIALTSHFTGLIIVTTSEKVFASMPEDYQKILADESKKEGEAYSKIVADSELNWIKKFEEAGVTVNEVDGASFREACAVVYEKFPAWSDGLYDVVQDALGYK